MKGVCGREKKKLGCGGNSAGQVNEFYRKGCQEKSSALRSIEGSCHPAHGDFASLGKFGSLSVLIRLGYDAEAEEAIIQRSRELPKLRQFDGADNELTSAILSLCDLRRKIPERRMRSRSTLSTQRKVTNRD